VRTIAQPEHAIMLAILVAIALAIYLVRRRRRNVDPDRGGNDHQQQPEAGHGPADPERHHL